ncbi:hypothetical protein [Lysinibacillus parviboronicapiens]|uniref:hypothetical protein n=1 Tax=Lysinibacillus parviboronicapiens TaxID=436516 RepID=UPI0006D0C759|nr:hypothetical protein [Lysinibacillus parviboronicapiens]
MSGNIATIIVKINKARDDLDFVSARGMIEANLIKLSENEYCSNSDISMLKRTLKTSFELVQRPDVLPLLNNDARIILDDMGALLGAHQLQ